MKKILFTLIIVMVGLFTSATNYYFKTAGNDGLTGLSDAQAWTYAKLSTFSFAAGDTAFLKRGETYNGTITPATSGTFANRIVFSAYGSGAKPIVSGFTTITGWSNEGDGIYSKIISAASTPNVLTINGVNTAYGRYPNTTFLTIDSHVGTTTITDAATPSSTINWTGAIMMVRFAHWLINKCPVTGHSGTTITYTNPISYAPTNGWGFFFENDVRTLDVLGEWAYVGGKLSVYFGAANPDTYTVKLSTINRCVSLSSRSYITIHNLNLQGANVEAVYSTGTYNTVKDCDISFCGDNGITLWSGATYNTVDGCNITQIQNRGVLGLAADQTIKNNYIHAIALLPGMGHSINKGQMAISCQGSAGYNNNTLIEYNRIDSIGYNGITFSGNNSIVRFNYVTNYCKNLDDGTGIYTGGNQYIGRKIYNNITVNDFTFESTSILGTTATTASTMGIYCDDNSTAISVYNNTTSTAQYGIYLHGSHEIEAYNNIVYNTNFGVGYLSSSSYDPMRNNNVRRNIIYATNATQYVTYHSTWTTDVALFGAIDSNYYCRPSAESTAKFKTVTVGATSYKTLAQWKTHSSLDANSFNTPYTSSNVILVYNPKVADSIVDLDEFRYKEANGTTHTGTATLGAYEGKLLFKDDTYDPVPEVLSIINLDTPYNLASRTLNIYASTIDDGGGTISERGIVWNTSPTPTTANNKQTQGTGLGVMYFTIYTLTPSTTYYMRAYAINEAGTAYSNEISFRTAAKSYMNKAGITVVYKGKVLKY